MSADNPLTTPRSGDPIELHNHPDHPPGAPPLRRRGLRTRLEPAAMAIMALGFVMMFQPFVQALFTYSFVVILAGTLMFIVVSHFSD